MARSQGPRVLVRLARTFTVTLEGVELEPARLGSRRARLLLELLAVERDRHLAVDEITPVLWPGEPPTHPDAGVATLVSRLRGVLGAGAITGARGTYRLGRSPDVEVDLDQGSALVEEAERRVRTEPALAATAAARALATLGPAVLTDAPYDEWTGAARAEHASLVRRARQIAARAALASGDARAAADHARAQIAADQLDEQAYRDLMAALIAAGERAAALAAYERLRSVLREELGIDPSRASHALFLAVLRDRDSPEEHRGARSARSTRLTGREREQERLEADWVEVAGGASRAVLLLGEAGIGKSTLAQEVRATVEATGGTVLWVRCFETERSLFLQPLVEAVLPVLTRLPVHEVAELVGDDAAVLAGLFPAVGTMLEVSPETGGSVELRRRRLFEAFAELVGRLAHRTPLLLVVDDLQVAGRSTLELLHFLLRRSPPARTMLLAIARVEDAAPVRHQLGPMDELELGPLDEDAVLRLAADAGRVELAPAILDRTSGHTLYVVEVLRSLASGTGEVPVSLQQVVLDRVRRTGPDCEAALRAGAVLGATVDPATLASLLGSSLQSALVACERALAARLLVVTGRAYEFAHDLVREVLYATTPSPTRVAHHRAAADLLTDRPETVAAHAAAAGDSGRAARAWLVAAEQGLLQLATLDAAALAGSAYDAAVEAGDAEVQARSLLVRGRAREAAGAFEQALVDLEAAVTIARDIGDRRLELLALRQIGGDVPTALGLSAPELAARVGTALRIAESIGDRRAEADLLGRLAVIAANRLRFTEAIALSERALVAARSSGDEGALCGALDGLKTSYAYLGEVQPLTAVLAELEPILRARRDMWLLPWAVFESAFVPLAAGDHAAAVERITTGLDLSRRGGWVSFDSWFVGHLGWADRLHGDLPGALLHGRESLALAERYGHPWWTAAAMSMLACTLLVTGETDEAVRVLELALPIAEDVGTEAYLLRCVAPLAQATGSAALLDHADQLLHGISCPPGSAWLLGSDSYVCTARAWLARGNPERARAAIAPLLAAARRIPWVPLLREVEPLGRAIPGG